MRIKYYMFAVLCGLLSGLLACSDHQEAVGEGFLSVAITVDTQEEIASRSAGSVVDSFVVEIIDTEGRIVKSFNSYLDLKESGTIHLEEGTYTIKVQSQGEMADLSDAPYYIGEKMFEIQPNLFTEVKVACRMQNAKVRLTLSEILRSSIEEDYQIFLSVGETTRFYSASDFSDGVSTDYYFAPAATLFLSITGTATTGDLFYFEQTLSDGVAANDFLTIHLGIKSKATRSLSMDKAFDLLIQRSLQ